jgi:hypothetical protein
MVDAKMAANHQKEQELILLEKQLRLKEDELLKREQLLDSARQRRTDSSEYNPVLIGNWNASMECTLTTCEGSAVGDTRTELWQVIYQDHSIIATVKDNNNQIIRTYTGFLKDRSLQLTSEDPAATTQMKVTLQLISDTEMEGQREITRSTCRIVYRMELNKS